MSFARERPPNGIPRDLAINCSSVSDICEVAREAAGRAAGMSSDVAIRLAGLSARCGDRACDRDADLLCDRDLAADRACERALLARERTCDFDLRSRGLLVRECDLRAPVDFLRAPPRRTRCMFRLYFTPLILF